MGIASSSLATKWIKGKSLDDAGKIKNSDIAAELCLPPVKLHCSMLAEDAIKAALKDYKVKNEKKTEETPGDCKCTHSFNYFITNICPLFIRFLLSSHLVWSINLMPKKIKNNKI